MTITCVQVDDKDEIFFRTSLGNLLDGDEFQVPFAGLTQKQLIAKKEEQTECGATLCLMALSEYSLVAGATTQLCRSDRT